MWTKIIGLSMSISFEIQSSIPGSLSAEMSHTDTLAIYEVCQKGNRAVCCVIFVWDMNFNCVAKIISEDTNSQPAITTQHLPHALNIVLSPR